MVLSLKLTTPPLCIRSKSTGKPVSASIERRKNKREGRMVASGCTVLVVVQITSFNVVLLLLNCQLWYTRVVFITLTFTFLQLWLNFVYSCAYYCLFVQLYYCWFLAFEAVTFLSFTVVTITDFLAVTPIDCLAVTITDFFSCHCPPGFYGIHCTKKTNSCSSGTSQVGWILYFIFFYYMAELTVYRIWKNTI